ncbi:VOC family protein [Streptomyces sp. NPDC102406]|uniref:VOC family protein n=1 Tax=Streptomyces sp. NPDC102406 TaxID=3366171 RepID=UPI0038126894
MSETEAETEAEMNEVRRAVPNVAVDGEEDLAANRAFYGALGFEEVMDLGWVMTMASPTHPTAQINFVEQGGPAPTVPDMSVEVSDVDAAYAAMLAAGADIVRDLRDEQWGVRRFFVRDPQGKIVNVLGHAPVAGADTGRGGA